MRSESFLGTAHRAVHSGKGFMAFPLMGQRPITHTYFWLKGSRHTQISVPAQVGPRLSLASTPIIGSTCIYKGPLSQVRKLLLADCPVSYWVFIECAVFCANNTPPPQGVIRQNDRDVFVCSCRVICANGPVAAVQFQERVLLSHSYVR